MHAVRRVHRCSGECGRHVESAGGMWRVRGGMWRVRGGLRAVGASAGSMSEAAGASTFNVYEACVRARAVSLWSTYLLSARPEGLLKHVAHAIIPAPWWRCGCKHALLGDFIEGEVVP